MDAPGTTHRNHCPTCLWSRHLDDDAPGDRAAECGSSMEPIAVCVRGDGEWALVTVARTAGPCTSTASRATTTRSVLMRLAVRPLAQPPFPLEWLATL